MPPRIVAEAVRLILDAELPPPREPGRTGSDDSWFDDNLDNLTGLLARTPKERAELAKLPFGFHFDLDAPEPVKRSAVNRDKGYRSRAGLREACRHDPSAFADAIPHDIADRVTVPNSYDEALAILDAVHEPRDRRLAAGRLDRDGNALAPVWAGRPAREWLHADPDEPVTLVGYTPPKPRRHSRPIPGVVVTREDGAIVLTLRKRDLDPPSKREAAQRQEAEPKIKATVADLAAYRVEWNRRLELAQRAA